MKNVILHPGKTCVDSFGYNSDSFPLDFKCIYKKKPKKTMWQRTSAHFRYQCRAETRPSTSGSSDTTKVFPVPSAAAKMEDKKRKIDWTTLKMVGGILKTMLIQTR